MPSLHRHGNHFILPKIPFKPIFSFPVTTFSSSTQNASFHHSPAIIQKFLFLLQSFSKTLIWVKSVHAQITTNSVVADQFLASKLVRAYSDFGHLFYARQLFDQITEPRTILCNAMIYGYLRNEHYMEALELFLLMGSCNIESDTYTCNFMLQACAKLGDYEMGMGIISGAMNRRMERDRYLGSSMINFLMNFGDVDEAKRVFDGMRERDVVCWNSMIGGYLQAGCYDKVFDLFFAMRDSGIRPSSVTMISLIQAGGNAGNLQLGRCVHGYVFGLDLDDDISVLTSLVDMYSKLGDIESARSVFDGIPSKNLVSWNAIISGYVHNGLINEAFDLFRRLVMSGSGFDSGTIVSIIQVCVQTADLDRGKILHGCVFRRGLDLNSVLLTAIVDLYCKCGALREATAVFDGMKDRNVITWTAMLVGLAQNGQAEDALNLFTQMQDKGVAANSVTLVSLIHCCAHLGSLKKGKSVHGYLIRHGHCFDSVNMTALVDVYAKCGHLKSAECLFNKSSMCRDVVLWNSMIKSYAMHGHGCQAVGIYNEMILEGVQPNETTFVCLLTACSHSGLVEEGIKLFNCMEMDHRIRPNDKHYACFVDLLSRAGRLEEAEALIKKMPFDPSSAVLEALLNGCRIHKKIDMGITTADRLLRLDAANPGIYIMLSNIYAEGRKWDAVDCVRGLMKKRGLKKTPGYSLIEVRNQVHTFFAGDDSHPKQIEINQFLEKLRFEVEACGHVPNTDCVLRDMDEAMKVRLLWGHSERLAIAFGVLSMPVGSSIRITKNLRVCVDCHVVTKYISKIVRREIIVRDANRFHHFIDGKCSCGDYW